MAVNKVVYGDNTLIDLSADTVTPNSLASGITAHAANGEEITGTMETRPIDISNLFRFTTTVGSISSVVAYAQGGIVHLRVIGKSTAQVNSGSNMVTATLANATYTYNGVTYSILPQIGTNTATFTGAATIVAAISGSALNIRNTYANKLNANLELSFPFVYIATAQ